MWYTRVYEKGLMLWHSGKVSLYDVMLRSDIIVLVQDNTEDTSWLLHFQSISLLNAWEDSRWWLKHLGLRPSYGDLC